MPQMKARLLILAAFRVLSSCTPTEVIVISSVPLLVRGTSTSRVPLHAGARTPVAAAQLASVPPRYQRFFTPTDPAATLWPSATLPSPTLLRSISPRGQEGFTSLDTTLSLRAAVITLPESAALLRQRTAATNAAFAQT